MSSSDAPAIRYFGSFSLSMLGAFASIYIIWGTTYLATAIAIETLPPFISGGVRFVLAGALMYVWLHMKNSHPFEGVNFGATVLCGVLLTGVGNGFAIWSQQGIPSGIAALMVAAVPVIVLILDSIFFVRRGPSRYALAGVAVALAGLVTIVMHTRTLTGNAEPLYVATMLLATTSWSLGTLLQKRLARPATVLSFTCGQMLAGGLFQILMGTATNEWAGFELAAVSWQSMVAVLYLITFGCVALNCYLWLLTRVSAQKVTTYALVNPVVALALGAVVLDERITPLVIAAAVLVVAGVTLVLFENVNPGEAPSRPP